MARKKYRSQPGTKHGTDHRPARQTEVFRQQATSHSNDKDYYNTIHTVLNENCNV